LERGHKEVEVVGVPRPVTDRAAALLSLVVDSVVSGHGLVHGETWGTRLGGLWVLVRVLLVKDGADEAFRLVDPEHKSAVETPPGLALSTVMYLWAQHAREQGRLAEARMELERAIGLYPGDPGRRDVGPPLGAVMNTENHLVYLAMAELSPDGGEGHYRMALERSAALQRTEMDADALPKVERNALLGDLRRMAQDALSSSGAFAEWRGGVSPALFQSPLWSPTLDGHVRREPTLLPREFARYCHDGAQAERLATDAELQDVIVSAYDKLRRAPLELLVATRDVRWIYRAQSGGVTGDDARNDARPYAPHHKMLSSLMADVARKVAAGLTLAEIRATLGLGGTGPMLASARNKMRAHATEEDRWYEAALGSAGG
jgi:hypothetical protein